MVGHGAYPSEKFTIQDIFRYLTINHSVDVTKWTNRGLLINKYVHYINNNSTSV